MPDEPIKYHSLLVTFDPEVFLTIDRSILGSNANTLRDWMEKHPTKPFCYQRQHPFITLKKKPEEHSVAEFMEIFETICLILLDSVCKDVDELHAQAVGLNG